MSTPRHPPDNAPLTTALHQLASTYGSEFQFKPGEQHYPEPPFNGIMFKCPLCGRQNNGGYVVGCQRIGFLCRASSVPWSCKKNKPDIIPDVSVYNRRSLEVALGVGPDRTKNWFSNNPQFIPLLLEFLFPNRRVHKGHYYPGEHVIEGLQEDAAHHMVLAIRLLIACEHLVVT